MDYETIELTSETPVATIRLNRPERMNAVIEAMYLEIQDALSHCETDAKTRCVIVTGSVLERKGVAKQAFCAGADLKHHAAGTRTEAQRGDYIRLAHETTRKIHQFPRPIIAAVNGPARGAGAELALNCDFVLMADEATLGFPEIGLGTFVGGGVTRILPRLIGLSRAKELVYTGRVINGTEAVALGLALASHRTPDLLTEARRLALELSGKAPVSIALAKRQLHESPDLPLETVLDLEAEAILECMKTEDWHEGLRAFSENRKPKFLGH
jgi:enoyl-CoA hydratase